MIGNGSPPDVIGVVTVGGLVIPTTEGVVKPAPSDLGLSSRGPKAGGIRFWPIRCSQMEPKQFAVYILASRSRTLYAGVTRDLRRGVW